MNSKEILDQLLDKLWKKYMQRVSYAAQYAKLVKQKGGEVQNDHIAFRTFNCKTGTQPAGVDAIGRIFEALGYVRKEQYIFTDKKLTAWHWEHAKNVDGNPKIFISQLEVEKLPAEAAKLIKDAVKDGSDPLTSMDIELLAALKNNEELDKDSAGALLKSLVDFFGRHWSVPKKSVIEKVNKDSQYAAWTLLHGNSVNHFTAYINKQRVKEWPDLETTHNGLKAAGIPMKSEFEGEKGSKLWQSSTQAVMEDCDIVEDNGKPGKIKWSYAYYELAERGFVTDASGKKVMFHGFLGEQATNLFEMTKTGSKK